MHSLTGDAFIGEVVPVFLKDEFFARLISFYDQQDEPEVTDIWKGIFTTFYGALKVALIDEDIPSLRKILGDAFNDCFLFGLDHGRTNPFYQRDWDAQLIRTAVTAGLLPAYSPEQSNPLMTKREDLLGGIESLCCRPIGLKFGPKGMFGVTHGSGIVPCKVLQELAVYWAARKFSSKRIESVLEIGGGNGTLATVFHLMSPQPLRYSIVDLPLVSVIQAYMIACIAGEESVALVNVDMGKGGPDSRFNIFGLEWPEYKSQVYINQDSLPEMPWSIAMDYVRAVGIEMPETGFFLSVNHESQVANQNRVFLLAAQNCKLRSVVRAPFLNRDGYMLEIFRRI